MISIIIPFYNEKENIPTLIKHLIKVIESIDDQVEVVLVDDGSDDSSKLGVQSFLVHQDHGGQANIKLISHRRRLGKGKALETGIENATGETIVFMDGDLQDDPEDLPKFLEKINQGDDLVNGVRTNRKDSLLVKIYSQMAGWFLKTFLHSPFTDINCPFKVFKRYVLDDFVLYGNNFRFFPLAVFYNGYKVTEIPVINHPRKFGRSKFGPSKLIGGVFDTLTAFFIYKFSEKPLHFFGPIGLIMFLIGSVITVVLLIQRLFYGILLYRRPGLFFGLILVVVGIQILMTGVVGELVVYLNKKSNKNKRI